jgi:hypothetical protein
VRASACVGVRRRASACGAVGEPPRGAARGGAMERFLPVAPPRQPMQHPAASSHIVCPPGRSLPFNSPAHLLPHSQLTGISIPSSPRLADHPPTLTATLTLSHACPVNISPGYHHTYNTPTSGPLLFSSPLLPVELRAAAREPATSQPQLHAITNLLFLLPYQSRALSQQSTHCLQLAVRLSSLSTLPTPNSPAASLHFPQQSCLCRWLLFSRAIPTASILHIARHTRGLHRPFLRGSCHSPTYIPLTPTSRRD